MICVALFRPVVPPSLSVSNDVVTPRSLFIEWGSCIVDLVKKSCQGKLTEAPDEQVVRREKTGYPESVILGVVEGILKNFKKNSERKEKPSGKKKNSGAQLFPTFIALFST